MSLTQTRRHGGKGGCRPPTAVGTLAGASGDFDRIDRVIRLAKDLERARGTLHFARCFLAEFKDQCALGCSDAPAVGSVHGIVQGLANEALQVWVLLKDEFNAERLADTLNQEAQPYLYIG